MKLIAWPISTPSYMQNSAFDALVRHPATTRWRAMEQATPRRSGRRTASKGGHEAREYTLIDVKWV